MTASRSFAPTAVSRSPAFNPPTAKRSKPPPGPKPPTSPSKRGLGKPANVVPALFPVLVRLIGSSKYACLATSESQVRHRNFESRQEAADPRHRAREIRHRAGRSRSLRPLQGQAVDGFRQIAPEQAERQAHSRLCD